MLDDDLLKSLGPAIEAQVGHRKRMSSSSSSSGSSSSSRTHVHTGRSGAVKRNGLLSVCPSPMCMYVCMLAYVWGGI